MSATLRLTRDGFGIELRRGTFNIAVDGRSDRTIEWHETVQVPIEAGHHTVQIKAGRYLSRAHSFDAADGQVVSFRCHGAMVWPRYVASIVKPDLAISLQRG